MISADKKAINCLPAKKVVGHVDNSEYPLIDVDISMVVVTPEKAEQSSTGEASGRPWKI